MWHRNQNRVALFWLITALQFGGTAEIDHFTTLLVPLNDSAPALNAKANALIQLAVERSNVPSAPHCSEPAATGLLYDNLLFYFDNHIRGSEFYQFYAYSPVIDRAHVRINESIYSGWGLLNGLLLYGRSADRSGLGISAIIRFNELRIGIDKFEHFFETGRGTFAYFYQQGHSFRETMKKDHLRERIIFGGNIIGTGVYSFADLIANFHGARFWNHVLQRADDLLGADHNLGPYIECDTTSGRWRVIVANPFDFNNYLDDAWDESINCSMYATASGAQLVLDNLAKLSSKCGCVMQCPISRARLQAMVDKYQGFGPYLLNLHGIQEKRFWPYFNDYGAYSEAVAACMEEPTEVERFYRDERCWQDWRFDVRLNPVNGRLEPTP